jgi:hypothetical protein
LTVTPKPKLRITELMPASDTNCVKHEQWFELTNHGTNGFNLRGCRFSDRLSFEGVVTITNDIIIQPGESVIFVERMKPEEFVTWWGADNLPPRLQISTYVGLGFAVQAINGDEGLYVWSAAAEELDDTLDEHIFATADFGFSLYFDCFLNSQSLACAFGNNSEVAQGGAFRAAECGDIGSPGYTTNPPPRFLSISRDETNVTVRWRAVEGRSYRLIYKDSLDDLLWRELEQLTATNSVQTAPDPTFGNAAQRFYQVEEKP